MNIPADFNEALTRAYRENPCQVLPNALWKSLPWLEEFETDFSIVGNQVSRLIAWKATHLMLYWKRDRSFPDRNLSILGDFLIFALLHKDFETSIDLDNFGQQESYFRLIHKMEKIPKVVIPRGYSFVTADPVNEAQDIAELIEACYDDFHPNSAEVRGWCEHPVFDADLWVWIIDEANASPVGLGIAEFNPSINEGSLEWIQVLPKVRRQGLGKQIVYELLSRLKGRAEFVTVAGKINDQTQPEKLYRSCGFEGEDVWWVLRK